MRPVSSGTCLLSNAPRSKVLQQTLLMQRATPLVLRSQTPPMKLSQKSETWKPCDRGPAWKREGWGNASLHCSSQS